MCLALGVYVYYGKVNTADALKKLPHTDKGSVGVDRIQPWPFDARAKVVSVVSEAGLYKLVMRSDSTEARKFQDWVTRNVLPAIRKDGGYIMGKRGCPWTPSGTRYSGPTIARHMLATRTLRVFSDSPMCFLTRA